ncbi:MAG: hypothetical protein K2I80_10475 [Ruminococcus sp.]|nr:hypothetical protein [Ruminococcus sp.]MDE6849481.1 hypothetical protein [Ruminococcus sp.]
MTNNSNLSDNKNNRLEFSIKIKKEVRMNVGGICCWCKKYTHCGVIAHIYPAAKNGPRSKEMELFYWINEDYITSDKNAIWLCLECHNKIDKKENEFKYTGTRLMSERKEVENWWDNYGSIG